MATDQYTKIKAEIDKLNAYRDSLKEISDEMKRLQAERDMRDGRVYRYSPEERAKYDQKIQELEQARQQKWSELQEKYNVHPGLMQGRPVDFQNTNATGRWYGNPDIDPKLKSLSTAIHEREAQLRALERSQPPAPPPVPQNGDPRQQATRETQAAHNEEFFRQLHQSYTKVETPPQPPPTHHERERHYRDMGGYQMADESGNSSAMRQQAQQKVPFIDRFKEDTPQGQQPSPQQTPTPAVPPHQVQPGHFRDLFTIGDQLKDIEKGVEQIKSEIDREQGQKGPWKTPFRQLFEQGPDHPPEEPEQGRSR